MLRIVAKLMLQVKCNEHAAGQPDRQTKYIDKREYFILPQIAPGYFKIVTNHVAGF
jgi:hypothetical protein